MRMDLDDMRKFVVDSGTDIWAVINAALAVASADYPQEFKLRRDEIATQLYASAVLRCQNCDANVNGHSDAVAGGGKNRYKSRAQSDESPETEHSHDCESPVRYEEENEDVDEDENCGEQDSENKHRDVPVVSELMQIKQNLEDDNQSDEYLLGLLQRLLEMEISVEALKESDIGRQVNALRKHSSSGIRKIVKQLIRNWKDLVDEWVNTTGEGADTAIVDEASPQGGVEMPSIQNPRPKYQRSHDSSSSQTKESCLYTDDRDPDVDTKGKVIKQSSSGNLNIARTANQYGGELGRLKTQGKNEETPRKNAAEKGMTSLSASEMLASAKKRLQEKYQEAENAKKQRTVQVMDLQDIPKPRNSFFSHGRGSGYAKHRFGGR